MGRLTTHVLDTSLGRPAAGVVVVLNRLEAGESTPLAEATTNADGRLDKPLLGREQFAPGTYELVFFAGAYLRARGVPLPDPPFLDVIPIRFGITEADSHLHVPLLLSPYGYTTYRGS